MGFWAYLSGLAGNVGGSAASTAAGPLMRAVDQTADGLFPNKLPDAPAIFKAMLQGTMTLDKGIHALRLQGINLDPGFPGGDQTLQKTLRVYGSIWGDVFRGMRALPALELLLQMRNRKLIDDVQADDFLKLLGWHNPNERQSLLELRFQLPPISDLIRFAVKDTQDKRIVDRFKLDDEFGKIWSGQLQEWLEKQGISRDVAKYYWRAHWQALAPGFAEEAVRRLRPGRVPAETEFTEGDYELMLAQNDIPEFFRQRMRQLVYRPFGLRFVRQLYFTSVINEAELSERLQDLGYKKADAELLVKAESIARARARATTGHGFTTHKIAQLYRDGALSEDEARGQMGVLGYTPGEAENLIQRVDREILAAAKVSKIKVLRDQFLKGEVDRIGARGALARLGFPARRVELVMDLWEDLKQRRLKSFTVPQLANWFRRGLLTADQLLQRLFNLGVTAEDSQRVLLAALQDIAKDRQRLTEKVLRNQQKDREQAARAAARDAKAAQDRAANRRRGAARRAAEELTRQARLAEVARLAELKEELAAPIDAASKARLRGEAALDVAELRAATEEAAAEIEAAAEGGSDDQG